MGQYYTAVIQKENGDMVARYTFGMKLMEHSWFGNKHCGYIASLIYKKKSRLGWIGDYAERDDFGPDVDYRNFYEFAWQSRNEEYGANETNDEELDKAIELDGKFFCNHDKKLVLDLSKYKALNDQKGWCINPISLLTAIGNGRGGGDYHENNPDFDSVGSWALDWVSVEDKAPSDYDSVMYEFKEV